MLIFHSRDRDRPVDCVQRAQGDHGGERLGNLRTALLPLCAVSGRSDSCCPAACARSFAESRTVFMTSSVASWPRIPPFPIPSAPAWAEGGGLQRVRPSTAVSIDSDARAARDKADANCLARQIDRSSREWLSSVHVADRDCRDEGQGARAKNHQGAPFPFSPRLSLSSLSTFRKRSRRIAGPAGGRRLAANCLHTDSWRPSALAAER